MNTLQKKYAALASTGLKSNNDLGIAPPLLERNIARSTSRNFTSALALTGAALAMTFVALSAQAEITQDCIVEGTVDMRKAEQLGQPTYVKFSKARRGSEATCNMNRRSKSRRVQYVSSPDVNELQNVSHGSKVSYRYLERDNQPGTWQLIEVK